jgi:limonene-1,2-epoxide hydrolase
MIDGSEIRAIVSNADTVVVERVDVNAMNGVAVTFHVTAIFEVRDGAITHWREYWDTSHVAQQLGIDPAHMFDALAG